MPVQFQDVAEAFARKKLRLPELNVLVPDTNLYDILAIQPSGAVQMRPDFIGHRDGALANAKFASFLQLAAANNSDLVLSPEYSLPWQVLTDAIVAHRLPQQGKLWILGCEAITPRELMNVIAQHPQLEWIHEPPPSGSGHFLGVLAYVTTTTTDDGVPKDVVVLQFKTQPMGGTNTHERDNLLRGNTIYFWHNPRDNIRLVSLLCSDAFLFETGANTHCPFDVHPHIIFHAQLNLDPRNSGFSLYRDHLFNRAISEHTEVFCLNWGRGFTIQHHPPSRYGGSAVYTKAPHFDFSDANIVNNHQHGLYFSYWHARRTQLWLFNYDEHVFELRMPKVRQDGAAAVARRTGPQMRGLRLWDPAHGEWVDDTKANDGYDLLCSAFNQERCDYCVAAPYTPVDRERLLMLANGNLPSLHPGLAWHHPENLDSFRAERDERTKRLTFTHEQAVDSNTYRHKHLGAFIKLQLNVLPNPKHFPPALHDLRNNWQLRPPHRDDRYRFNLFSRNGLAPGATAIFVGTVPPGEAVRLRDSIIRAWGKGQTRRLAIWYEVSDGFFYIGSPEPGFDDDEEPPDSYVNPSHEHDTNA